MHEHTRLYIGGDWVVPSTTDVIDVVSPHSEETIARVAAPATADIDRAVSAARHAFDEGLWPHTDPEERVDVVRKLLGLYESRRDELAELVTSEMGAPITFSVSAHARLPGVLMSGFADLAEKHTWEETRRGFLGNDVVVRKRPVGVAAGIIPWNMPMFLTVVKLIPPLLAGCSVVLKPSPETPLNAYLLAELLEHAGVPRGVVSIIPGGREIGEYLVAHPGVDTVSFTGSTESGKQVATACAAGLKRVSLELGGKSAAIVLDDADPERVAAGIKVAGVMNGGQACVAQTRILVPESRYDEHVDALATMLHALHVGDPFASTTQVGPMVSRRQQHRIRNYIELGDKEGARLVVGGSNMPTGMERGWYIRPTLFADVDNSMRIAREEIFGPVLTVIPYTDDSDAVRIADDSEYGLSGSVWTPDLDRGIGVARSVRTGTFGVNEAYSMDPAAPFGGVKMSGYGREFGPEGLDEYLETQSLSIVAH